MDNQDSFDLDGMFGELEESTTNTTPPRPALDMQQFLRKIPVRLTLEVGNADISLADLAAIEHGSVVELDKLAGEPLNIRVNGALIGRAEVVVSGENYGLRVVELNDLDLDTLAP